jgi:hypothetical protein
VQMLVWLDIWTLKQTKQGENQCKDVWTSATASGCDNAMQCIQRKFPPLHIVSLRLHVLYRKILHVYIFQVGNTWGSPVEDAVISVFPDTPSAKDDEGV